MGQKHSNSKNSESTVRTHNEDADLKRALTISAAEERKRQEEGRGRPSVRAGIDPKKIKRENKNYQIVANATAKQKINSSPFACSFSGCSYRFKTQNELDQHLYNHQQQDGGGDYHMGESKESASITFQTDLEIDAKNSEEMTPLEKAFHELSQNSPDVLVGTKKMLFSICSNILSNPEDPKYRKLKISSKPVQKHIIPVPGAFETVLACGFELQSIKSDDEDGVEESWIVLAAEKSLDQLQIAFDLHEQLSAS